MTIRRIAILLLLGLLFYPSFFSVAQTDSCAITWDNIIQISHDTAFSVAPQIVAVGDSVHLLWFGDVPIGGGTDSGLGIQYARSTDGGQNFSQQKQLVTYDSTAAVGGNKLAASGPYVYMAYFARVDSPVYSNLGVLCSTDAGMTWQSRILLGEVSGRAIAAKDSSVYIYFTFVQDNFVRSGFFISHDYGVTWDSIHVPEIRASFAVRLTATTTALHMIRERLVNSASEVFYNRSPDFGYTWAPDDTLSTVDGWQSSNARLVSSGVSLYTTWTDGKYGGAFSGTILMRRSTDGGVTWLPEQTISQLSTANFSDVAADGMTVAVAWDNEPGTLNPIFIRLSRDLGQTWCSPTSVSSDSVHAGNPSIGIAFEKVHVAWWNVNIEPSAEIYYRRGSFLPTSVEEQQSLPPTIRLGQNYPNPFNPSTIITYHLPANYYVTLKVYDLLGREVTTLVDGSVNAGSHEVTLDGSNISAGVYFYRLRAGEFTQTRKLLLIK